MPVTGGMPFLELVRARQSTREYTNQPVEREKIERCLEAARLAPSACNSQPWKFVVVDEPKLGEAVARRTFSELISFNRFVLQAPVIVVLVVESPGLAAQLGGAIKGRQLGQTDIGIATEHFCLQATEQGLGSCILGWFDERGIKRLLGIPRQRRIGLLIALGYPASREMGEKERKAMGEMRSYNKY